MKASQLAMSPSYSWRCFVCDSVNGAGAVKCSSCEFPVRASGTEIEKARSARSGIPVSQTVSSVDVVANLRAALKPLPLWRQAIAVVGGALVFLGAVWFKITFSLAGFAMSALAVALGLLVLGLAYSAGTGKERPKCAG